MKMVILTPLEARHVLKVLDDGEAYFLTERLEAIEIMEEALHQPQEYEIPDERTEERDSKDTKIQADWHTNTHVV